MTKEERREANGAQFASECDDSGWEFQSSKCYLFTQTHIEKRIAYLLACLLAHHTTLPDDCNDSFSPFPPIFFDGEGSGVETAPPTRWTTVHNAPHCIPRPQPPLQKKKRRFRWRDPIMPGWSGGKVAN